MASLARPQVLAKLREGMVIPAHPLALTAARRLDERRQRALTRYYLSAGAGGVAVAVHTAQFEIRKPQHGLLEPVLGLAAEVCRAEAPDAVRIAGICGRTDQAVAESGRAGEIALYTGNDDHIVGDLVTPFEVVITRGTVMVRIVGGLLGQWAVWTRAAVDLFQRVRALIRSGAPIPQDILSLGE
ncbi:MAG: hypothetical protein NUV94_06730, partial [Candidatus Acetothermia bacterium]|nr:hypothetical protein [Candidatus Acetothermia bacterium]